MIQPRFDSTPEMITKGMLILEDLNHQKLHALINA